MLKSEENEFFFEKLLFLAPTRFLPDDTSSPKLFKFFTSNELYCVCAEREREKKENERERRECKKRFACFLSLSSSSSSSRFFWFFLSACPGEKLC